MAIELNAKSWKKHKALTLIREPLTKALEEYDKIEAKRKSRGWREDHDGALYALGAVQVSIEETLKKCSDKHHEETKGHLAQLKKLAEAEKKQLLLHQQNMETYAKNVGVAIKAMLAAWQAAVAARDEAHFLAFAAAAKKAHQDLALQESGVVGDYFGQAGATLTGVTGFYANDDGPEAARLAKTLAQTGDAQAQVKLTKIIQHVTESMKTNARYMKEFGGHLRDMRVEDQQNAVVKVEGGKVVG